jgi:hypothetical protein
MKTFEMTTYYIPAVANITQQTIDQVYKYVTDPARDSILSEFDKKIGAPSLFHGWLRGRSYDDKHLTEEMRDLLIKLAGPNGHFWLAYYRVQKGLTT